MASLVPDDTLTIDEGAVAPWNSLMWSLMTDVCREMGVRTDVPFHDLTDGRKRDRLSRTGCRRSIFFTKQRTPIRRESWILPITMPFTPWKTHLPGSRTKRA
ncbi:MAG: hypothetical protein ACLU3I_19385 [Acutalibacteraceae bacterium]